MEVKAVALQHHYSVTQDRDEAIDTLSRLVDFVKPDQVRDYLANHPDLISPMYDAIEKAKEIFGKTPIRLEIFFDPEEKTKELLLSPYVNMSFEEARKRAHRFYDEWLDKQDVSIQESLGFLVRYV